MSSDFSLGFDMASLATLVRLTGFSVFLDEEITDALVDIGGTLVQAAQANTWEVFESPTGRLAESIYPFLSSPGQLEIRVGAPYGRRREMGFSGMTDSLGRYYASDPAKPYLQPALDEDEAWAVERLGRAVTTTWIRIGAP